MITAIVGISLESALHWWYVRHHATIVELAIVGTVDSFTKGKVANP